MKRKLILAFAAFTLPSAANASLKIDTVWGQHCSKARNSMAVRAKNTYSYSVDMRLCAKRRSGKWQCWVANDVKPGEWESRQTDSSPWGYFICDADGEYYWSVRRAGRTETAFGDPPGYRPPAGTRPRQASGKPKNTVQIQTAWDKNCTKPGSMAIKGTNRYAYPIDLRLCLKRTTGKWTCYVSPDVKAGATAPSSWAYYVCNADGEYFWSARRAGAWSVKFDDPPGYKRK